MKQLIFVSTNTSAYGAERSLVTLASEVKARADYGVIVIIPRRGDICNLLSRESIDFLILPFQGSVNHNKGCRYIYGYVKLMINYFCALILFFFLRVKKLEVELVHSNTITSDFGYCLSRIFAVDHIWHFREVAKAGFGFDFELGLARYKRIVSRAAAIIAISKFVKDYYQEVFDISDISLVYNGVQARHEDHSPEDSDCVFSAVMVGRLSPDKNFDFVIRAAKYLLDHGCPPFRIDFWGDGSEQYNLERLSQLSGTESVIRFRGFCENVPLSSYSIALSCGPNEAFGRVTVEYMLAGLPVLGVFSSANPELYDTSMGFFYSDGSLEDFSAKFVEGMSDLPSLQEKGYAAKRHAQTKFNVDNYVNGVLDVYSRREGV